MKAVLFALLAGLCWGLGELCTKSVLAGGRIGPITAIAVRSTVALPVLWLACCLALGRWRLEPHGAWRALGGADLVKLLVGSGLVAGALGMIFFYAALNLGEISRIKPIAFATAPAIAAVLGWQLLGETMTWRKALALLLIVGGVFLLTGEARTPRAGGAGLSRGVAGTTEHST